MALAAALLSASQYVVIYLKQALLDAVHHSQVAHHMALPNQSIC